MCEKERLEALHDPRGLERVRLGAYEKIDIRGRNAEVTEEGARQLVVVVLARVDDDLVRVECRRGPVNRRQFGEVGARTNDVKKTHE